MAEQWLSHDDFTVSVSDASVSLSWYRDGETVEIVLPIQQWKILVEVVDELRFPHDP